MARPGPDILLRIKEVGDVTPGGGVPVTLEGGKKVCLPYDDCDWIPGAVAVPVWLARKIKKEEGRKGNDQLF